MKLKASLFLISFLTAQIFAQQLFKLGIPYGHNANKMIQSVFFSPNGKLVLSASLDETACLWEIATGRLLYRLKCPGEPLAIAVFSHDGSKIVTMSHTEKKYPFVNRVRIWNTKDGSLLDTLPAIEDAMTKLYISPDDGRILLGGSGDSCVQLWDIAAHRFVAKSALHNLMVSACGFSTDGKYVYSASWDKKAFILDANDLHLIHSFSDHAQKVNCAGFDRNNKYFFTATEDGTVKIWDVNKGALLKSFNEHKGGVVYATFDSSGYNLASISMDGRCCFYSIQQLKLTWKTTFNGIIPNQMAFLDNDSKLLISDMRDTVYIVSTLTGKRMGKMEGGGTVTPFAFTLSQKTQRFAAASNFGRIQISDLKTGKYLYTIADHSPAITQLWLDKSKQYITAESFPYSLGFWNGKTGESFLWHHDMPVDGNGVVSTADNTIYMGMLLGGVIQLNKKGEYTGKRFGVGSGLASGINLLPAHKKLLTTYWDGKLKVYSTEDAKTLFEARHAGGVYGVQVSPDEKEFATCGFDSVLNFFAEADNSILKSVHFSDRATSGLYSPDGRYYIQLVGYTQLVLFNAKTKDIIDSFSYKEGDMFFYVHSMVFSPDGNYLFTGLNDGKIIKFNTPNLKMVQVFNNHQGRVNKLSIHPYAPLLLSAGEDIYANCWNYNTGQLLTEFKGHTAAITTVNFLRDTSMAITSSADGTVRFWEIKSGTEKLAVVSVDSSYVLLRPDGYFMAPGNAVKKLYYTDGEKTVGFEQLDLRNNRPDLVTETLGEIYGDMDTSAVKGYRSAYAKRLKKLGIDPQKFTTINFIPPQCEIKNANEIELNAHTDKLALNVHAKAEKSALRILNCWINGVPVFGASGINISRKNVYGVDTQFVIVLSEGMNKIEVSCIDELGTESFRTPVYTTYRSKIPISEKIYFVGIGADHYKDTQHNLTQSCKDIRDMASVLRKRYKNRLIVDTLFNEKVTLENVIKLKRELMQSGVNDKVIVSFSGHGLLDEKLDYYLGAYNIDFADPSHGGIPYDSLEWVIDNIPARKKLLFLDACHSGELDKSDVEIISNSDTINDRDSVKLIVQRGGSNLRIGKSKSGLQNSFLLMQEVFVQVGRGTGTNIISAAAGSQFALESASLKNGLFTWCILNELARYPSISIQKLSRDVTAMVLVLSHGFQKPTFRSENVSLDWEL